MKTRSCGPIFDKGKGFFFPPKDQTVSGTSQTSYLLVKRANYSGGKVAVAWSGPVASM